MIRLRMGYTDWEIRCERSGSGAGYAPKATTTVYFEADGQRRVAHRHLLPAQVVQSAQAMRELFTRSKPD